MDSTPAPREGAGTRRRRRLRGLAALPLAALALSGCTLSDFGAYSANTKQSVDTVKLWQWFTIGAIVIGGFVLLLILWAVLRYRRKGDTIPKQVQYHIPLELLYTIVPILIVVALFVGTIVVENEVTANPKPAVTVDVTAFQWGWKFQYPGTNALVTGQTTSEPMFLIPENENVRFYLRSSDVVHGFYIREFDFSRYAQPGVLNEFTFDATKPGVYFGQCSQLCGLYHTLMWFRVDVVSDAAYRKWVDEFNTPAGARAAEAASLATKIGVNTVTPTKTSTTTGAK